MYTTDTVPLGYGLVCHNSTFVRLLLVNQSIFNSNLTVNILLKAFKSFIRKYNIVCIFIQANHFNTHAIFMSFISQSINCLKSLKTNHFKHKSICTFFLIISKIQIISLSFKYFRNRERVSEQTKNRRFDSNLDFNTGFPPRQALFKYNDNYILVGYSRSFWLGLISIQYSFT